ncbi:hypothetical protein BB558_000979 [Smittium angustum]|uniref:Uncharacterized protein n=1 Tax=Smittium angustum TaxID=133377 RepID=A0A2U1JD18_SMIAN|nr:hypothetical protein BB558_000979 [Smittium angustum]
MSKKTQQIAIAFCYFETLSAPPELEWDGYDDSMERFLGLRKTTVLINQCCAANQKILLGISAAHSLLLRLNLTVSSIFAFKQGNNDLESPWAKSRLKWVIQLSIRLGILLCDRGTMRECSDYYKIEKIGSLSLS